MKAMTITPAEYTVAPTDDDDDRSIRRALRIIETRARKPGTPFTKAEQAGAYFRLRLAQLEHEVFSVAFLTEQHALIACEDMFRGSLTQASVYPREVVKRALELNAAAVVFAHNHPSGTSDPSRADELLTQALKSALALVSVRVLDHIVVTATDAVSMASRGLL